MQHPTEKPLAIVGMSCRLPGADNLDEFWELLLEGRSQLGVLPAERFDSELHYHPDKGIRTKSYTTLGGVVNRPNVTPETHHVDQSLIDRTNEAHLTLLDAAMAACDNAGYDRQKLQNRRVGVYVGHTPPSSLKWGSLNFARNVTQSAQYLRETPAFGEIAAGDEDAIIGEIIATVRAPFANDEKAFEVQAHAFYAASTIAKALDLDGPAMSFDAACASSMRALGHAARALQFGQIEAAIVGGASICHCDTLVLFSQAQSVSPTGSRPFDDAADGLVASEGYVVLVLKTLEQAVADGDDIKAVIRGIGISSDGKGKSLWAPRAEGQIEAIRRAYPNGVGIADLQFIEMHATSTQVGDATEMSALTAVVGDTLPAGTHIPVGSVKANVGHTLETAGLASLCKTVLAMRHGIIPPQINITKLNDAIDWANIPFFVPTQAIEWPAPTPGAPRRAAVNAFGIGGLNVHVVLEEYLPGAPSAPARSSAGDTTTGDAAHEPIAVVGMGAVFPGAHTIEALYDVLRSGADQKHDVPLEPWTQYVDIDSPEERRWRVPIRHAGFIEGFAYDWKKHRVPPKQVASADPLQFMLLDAADQALRDAGYHERPFDHQRTGVIVGTVFGNNFSDKLQMGLRLTEFERTLTQVLRKRGVPDEQIHDLYRQYEQVLLQHAPALVDETGSFTSSTLASRITKTFDLMGGAVAVDAGDTSAMTALAACVDMLRAGDCDMMLCASGQMAMTSGTYASMWQCGYLANGVAKPPFDARTDGFEPGEAVGVVLLKRLSDARRDGDKIYAVIRGIGAGRDKNLARGIGKAIERGLEAAGLESKAVSLIETGALGVPEQDLTEVEALAGVFGRDSREQPILIGSTAAQFGYVGGMAGMAALMKAIVEVNDVALPGIPGLTEPHSAIASRGTLIHAPQAPALLPALNDDGRMFAGVNSYSIHGTAYHMVIEGMTRVPKDSAAQPVAGVATTAAAPVSADCGSTPWRIVRIGATGMSDLVAKVPLSAENADELYARAGEISFTPSDKARLAIVTDSGADLRSKLEMGAQHWFRAESRQLMIERGIFFGDTSAGSHSVAFLFPGQGSQYIGMLRELIDQFPPARQAMDEIDQVLVSEGIPSFAELAWSETNPLGNGVWRTQLSLLAANTIMLAAVTALGLKADRVAGHSFGELAALLAGGSWTFRQALRATIARCAAIDSCQHANGMLISTDAPAAVLAQLCAEVGDGVWVSHYNAPDQSVAGGRDQAVALLKARVEQAGYRALPLDVPAAFHTPLMEEVKAPFARGLAEIAIAPPRIPLLSSVTNRYVAEPEEIRENLLVQMTQPVRYADLIERLANEGVSVLVEVGPKQVLTGLHKRTLAERFVSYVGTDHPKRTAMQQLLFARACVECTGVLDPKAETTSIDILDAAAPAGSESPTEAATSTDHAESDLDEAASTPIEAGAVDVVAPHDATAALDVLQLSGTPYEMGLQHGRTQKDAIRRVLRRYADLAGSDSAADRTLAAAVIQPEAFFGAEELEELLGIAAGAEVTLESVVAHNLRLYLDAGSGGVHFAVSASANPQDGLVHAANEELQHGLCVDDCLARTIQVRRPAAGIGHVTFAAIGQLSGLNGVNAHGIVVSMSALIENRRADVVQAARLPTVLVKNILERAATIDEAIEIVRQTRGCAAFSLCLSHHSTDRICYIEFDGASLKVIPATSSIVAANHSVMTSFAPQGAVPESSQLRYDRLKQLLGGDKPADVSVSKAREVLLDKFDPQAGQNQVAPTLNTLRRVDNQISFVVQPATGNAWVTGGPMSNGYRDKFMQLNLAELLSEWKTSDTPPSAQPPTGLHAAASRPEKAIAPGDVCSAYEAAESHLARIEPRPVCARMVMRILEQSLPAQAETALPLAGAALVLGQNAAAAALVQRLAERGATVYQLPQADSLEELLATVDAVWQAEPAPHLFIATACDDDAVTSFEPDVWNARRHRGVSVPYFVAQRWYQRVLDAHMLDRASIVAVTMMGGDFGFSSRLPAVEGGALTGLCKGLRMETSLQRGIQTFLAKVVDVSPDVAADELADIVANEFASGDTEMEVGYIDGRRYFTCPVAEPIVKHPLGDLPAGAPFVVTGGARGVTAVVARELGKRYPVKLHLLGSSPVPEIPDAYLDLSDDELKELKGIVMKESLANGEKPADGWARFEKALEIDKTLRELQQAGVQATYHACDVTDRESLARVLDEIRAGDGPIQGVIHGAGFERASSFEKKKLELVERTIAAKVDGAKLLMELTQNDPLRYFAAFGSVSGRFGGVGQTDYCVANDMMAKLIDWYRRWRPECGASVFHWHAWDDVGMAVRPESKHIRQLHTINSMPSLEGAQHLIDELRAGLPEGEIVITELSACRDRYVGLVSAAGNEVSAAQSGPHDLSTLPMIDAVVEQVPGQRLSCEVHLDPVNDLFLVQHRFKGAPMMPVVMTMEALVEAALLADGGHRQVAGLRNIQIKNGLRFLTENVHPARIYATVSGNHVAADFTCDSFSRSGKLLQKDKPYLSAVVELCDQLPELNLEPMTMPTEWTDCWYPEEDIVIWHGPEFRCLKQVAGDGAINTGWGRLVAPDVTRIGSPRQGTGWIMPSAVLDSCFFACGIYLWVCCGGVVAIPAGIDAIRLGRHPHPQENCIVQMKYRGREGDQGIFDFAIYGEDGTGVLALEGYRNIIVAESPVVAAPQ